MAETCLSLKAGAAIHYASPDGDDSNSGSALLPWRTIQRSVLDLEPGDQLIVRPGDYPEYVSTIRGGSSEAARITIRAEGKAVMKGWRVNHPFITVEGFEFTGLSSAHLLDATVRVGPSGDDFELLHCICRDATQIVLDDIRFDAATRRILSETGGFVASGFAAGQYISANPARRGVNLAFTNSLPLYISEISDRAITVTNQIVEGEPASTYLSASFQYGLYLESESRSALIDNCTFRNLGFDAWFVFGTDHTLENNLIETMNGWDAMHFGGTNILFRRNVIRNSPLKVFQPSADALENYQTFPYSRVVFKQNLVAGFDGVIASHKGGGTSSNLLLLRNVFYDTGWFVPTHPHTRIENNTFVRCAKTPPPTVSAAHHPITLFMEPPTATGKPNARDSTLINNVFWDCGQAFGPIPAESVGWYEIRGSLPSLVATGNFVAGPGPDFASKTGWPEAPHLNGGDPLFSDATNPIGLDGIPFTVDDGLRPKTSSRLVGSGALGKTIGAYEVQATEKPRIRIGLDASGAIHLSWRSDVQDWTLESALTPGGPWQGHPTWPVVSEGRVIAAVTPSLSQVFFRLAD